MRIAHVTEWMTSNLSWFKAEHANVEALQRAFDSSVVDLRAIILTCKPQCQSCHLSCLHSPISAFYHNREHLLRSRSRSRFASSSPAEKVSADDVGRSVSQSWFLSQSPSLTLIMIAFSLFLSSRPHASHFPFIPSVNSYFDHRSRLPSSSAVHNHVRSFFTFS